MRPGLVYNNGLNVSSSHRGSNRLFLAVSVPLVSSKLLTVLEKQIESAESDPKLRINRR